MTISPLPRRTMLQAGAAVAVPLLAGFWPSPSEAAPGVSESAVPPVSGMLAGWVVVEPDHGAAVRLMQLDAASKPVRQIAGADLSLAETGASLQQVCQRAHEMTLEAVARSWGVPMAECVVSQGRIAHEGRGQSVRYTLWTDVI